MRASRVVIILLVLGCFAGAGMAWRLETQITRFRVKVDQDKTAAGAGLDAAKKNEADLKARLAALEKKTTPPAAGADKSKTRSAVDPEARKRAMVAFARTWLDAGSAPMYAHLTRSLGLSDNQIDQLRD